LVALSVAGGDDRPNFFAGGSDATVRAGSLQGVLAGCVAAAEVFDDDGQYILYQLGNKVDRFKMAKSKNHTA
jgi:hypothetical protein